MPLCLACNEANSEGARFCSSCGALLHRDAAGAIGARKTVTVVFADVVGSTSLVEKLEPESARRVLDRFFDSMHEVVVLHGGRVEKFIGDAVMAVFGVPVLHEDDPLRAVRATAAMQTALERLDDELEAILGVAVQMRIGVATGEVVTGDPSSGMSFVTGDAVNVAARLEAAAEPGDVLVDEATYRRVRYALSVEPMGPMLLKGKAEPVAVHRLVDVGATARRRVVSGFVGRKRELDRLSELVDHVRQERVTRLVTVIGDAGVGKSRMVEELLATRVGDATVVRGRCLPYGEGITYWPVKEAIGHAAGLRGDESVEEARARVRALLGSAADAELVTERLAETIGLSEAVAEHKGSTWATGRIFEEVATTRPLIVVFDDIQWGETMFLDLVEGLVDRVGSTQLLVLCMARPELLEVRLSWASPNDHSSLVFLDPLSEEDAEQLLESLLDGTALEAGARARIVEASGGLPLFVEEMVAMLIDQGTLRREDGRWVAADLSRIVAPATIHALLAARLDQLDSAERAVLERGSIEGQVFHRGAVEYLSPERERRALKDRLSALVLKALIEPEGPEFSADEAFRFHHLLLRDVAYESVQKEERALLHERFAVWLEAQTRERASEYDEILGYHLEQAWRYDAELHAVGSAQEKLAARAANRLGSAGLRAHARGDWSAAASLLARAADLLPVESDTRASLTHMRDEALVEIAPTSSGLLAAARCFWRWPLGHRWSLRARDRDLVLRCSACGREKLYWSLTEGGAPDTFSGPGTRGGGGGPA